MSPSQRKAVAQRIAQVLRRANREAETDDEPSEARGIFHAAQSFADEFAAADPGFVRGRFIKDVTADPS
jgi:hypothetical protein